MFHDLQIFEFAETNKAWLLCILLVNLLQKLHLIKCDFGTESSSNRFHSTLYHYLAAGSVAQEIFAENFEALTIGYFAYMVAKVALFLYFYSDTQKDYATRYRKSRIL